ncbi:MAG: Crp/Fnr family transcriptional regulator [Cyanobacteria bacterium]|nr:Crp/Fnr family transcriptional regulator [Cyanobacteriota bacterium]MDW8203171.1 Crp/Fnr family transcriptional regulator [Cyanobacteriota bacterium SKYGB_h_bin112]
MIYPNLMNSTVIQSNRVLPRLDCPSWRSLKRREHLPSYTHELWQIESGAVRTYTLADDGTVVVLGFWGVGDTIGNALSQIQPCISECLTDVQIRSLPIDERWNMNQTLQSHLQQAQELLRIRSGQIHQRLEQLLSWLAYKFGCELEEGQLIKLRLTHQDFAETLGTTRVTVTRLLSQLEREGRIQWVEQHLLLRRE